MLQLPYPIGALCYCLDMYRIKELFMFIIGCIFTVVVAVQMVMALFHGAFFKAFVYFIGILFLLYVITLLLEVEE